MADLDFLDALGISEQELGQPENAYEKFILQLSKQVTKNFKEYINQNARNTGGLAQSVVYFPTGSLSFEIQADDYYKFMDEGVNAVGTNNQQSSYSFRTPYVSSNHAKAIQQWKGYTLPHAYASASLSKNKYGLKGHHITDNVMTEEQLTKISNDLASVTGLMFTVSFEKNTQKWQ
ncbi:hypothetical protein UFOVP633_16 [uncultured Caudovirales phage]|jgi:hypothetical protein|uniref:Uncharacterized protein n=1 Tax=uncultured Caudovirales phage TaxID=2100421 RepID=A0A6J5N3R6_9CAUD|nr:hypothetical protein UFOVP633_16 [uncultured Caudovirales phage]